MAESSRALPDQERIWLTTRELQAVTGRSVYALRSWAKNGLVPAHLICATPGGYLWHRDFAARPQPLTIRVKAAQE